MISCLRSVFCCCFEGTVAPAIAPPPTLSRRKSSATDQRIQDVGMTTLAVAPFERTRYDHAEQLYYLRAEKNWLVGAGEMQQFQFLLNFLHFYQKKNVCAMVINHSLEVLMVTKCSSTFTGYGMDDLIGKSIRPLLKLSLNQVLEKRQSPNPQEQMGLENLQLMTHMEEENGRAGKDLTLEEILTLGSTQPLILVCREIDPKTGVQKELLVRATTFLQRNHNHILVVIKQLPREMGHDFIAAHQKEAEELSESLPKQFLLKDRVYVFQPEYEYPGRGILFKECLKELGKEIYRNADEMTLLIDKQCRIMALTETGCALTGYKVQELIAKQVHILFSEIEFFLVLLHENKVFQPKDTYIYMKSMNANRKTKRRFLASVSLFGPCAIHYYIVQIRKTALSLSARSQSFTLKDSDPSTESPRIPSTLSNLSSPPSSLIATLMSNRGSSAAISDEWKSSRQEPREGGSQIPALFVGSGRKSGRFLGPPTSSPRRPQEIPPLQIPAPHPFSVVIPERRDKSEK